VKTGLLRSIKRLYAVRQVSAERVDRTRFCNKSGDREKERERKRRRKSR
jgi:hypothetical protein